MVMIKNNNKIYRRVGESGQIRPSWNVSVVHSWLLLCRQCGWGLGGGIVSGSVSKPLSLICRAAFVLAAVCPPRLTDANSFKRLAHRVFIKTLSDSGAALFLMWFTLLCAGWRTKPELKAKSKTPLYTSATSFIVYDHILIHHIKKIIQSWHLKNINQRVIWWFVTKQTGSLIELQSCLTGLMHRARSTKHQPTITTGARLLLGTRILFQQ